MSVRPIIQHSGQDAGILRQAAQPVLKMYFDRDLQPIITDMVDTMRSCKALGLAAPQIGIDLAVFVVDRPGWNDGYQVVANPRLLTMSRRMVVDREGCLSVADREHGPVARPRIIEAMWQGPTGKFCSGRLIGLRARVFLHEFDHLRGRLYTDRLVPDELALA